MWLRNVIDRTKFKLSVADPTCLREERLQRFLRKRKNEEFFNEDA